MLCLPEFGVRVEKLNPVFVKPLGGRHSLPYTACLFSCFRLDLDFQAMDPMFVLVGVVQIGTA